MVEMADEHPPRRAVRAELFAAAETATAGEAMAD
jgi:hypothetical protein